VKTATDWRHWTVLAVLLLASAGIGVNNLNRHSLWLDEYWALCAATGRGDAFSKIPVGKVLNPPPEVEFAEAPSWPHIWTSLDFVTHPPMHFLVLRAWVAMFGESDRAIRSSSLFFFLAGMVLLFDTLRRRRNAWESLISVGLMAASVPGIDFASEARPYTLAVFVGLICCRLMLSVEEHGAKLWRVVALAISVLLLCLTHYLALAPAAAIAAYAAIRLRGAERKRTLIAIGVGGLVFLLAWGPMMPGQRGTFELLGQVMSRPPFATWGMVVANFLSAPQTLLLGQFDVPIAATCVLAGLFFIAPPAGRLQGDDLLWWMWGLAAIGLAAGDDLLHLNHREPMGGIPKYVFLASPAVFALIKPVGTRWLCRVIAPLAVLALFADSAPGFGTLQPGVRVWLTVQQIGIVGIVAICVVTAVVSLPRAGWFGTAAIVCLAILAAANRLGGDDAQAENWKPNRELAAAIENALAPGDLLIFSHSGDYNNFWSYFIFQHYANDKSHAVMLADSPQEPHPPAHATGNFTSAVMVTTGAEKSLVDLPGWHVIWTSPRIGTDVVVRLQK
jgi:hypothetical protein